MNSEMKTFHFNFEAYVKKNAKIPFLPCRHSTPHPGKQSTLMGKERKLLKQGGKRDAMLLFTG